ncbi:MAG: NeuD/PglB/VioB family sugar acetyltransferase [Deltaproteobacteria bacterium]|nr:NeuD/PglB/VioB family sugar acetyltransferase [Deltaproteobacteria bacterium]
MGPLVVYGAGGHGKVVSDAARAQGYDVLGFGDDDEAKRFSGQLGLSVVCIGLSELREFCDRHRAKVVVAIGENERRAARFSEMRAHGFELATVVHPSAVVSPSATIGAGTVVFAGVVINADATVGQNIIVNTLASIEHDNVIGDHAHICPGVRLGGGVSVGVGTQVGIGSCVRDQTKIGAYSLIGAGSVVVADIGDRVQALGCPARVVKDVSGWAF